MGWLKKPADTLIILGAVLLSMLWVNGKFKGLKKELAEVKKNLLTTRSTSEIKQIGKQWK